MLLVRILLIGFLLALPGLACLEAAAWPLEVTEPGVCWTLRLTRESPVIPLTVRYEDVSDEGSKLAVLADAGNQIVAYVRDRQDDLRWFIGVVTPSDSCTVFRWHPDWRLGLVLENGRRLMAEEIFATRGRADVMGPRLPIQPGGVELRFEDFRVTFPAGERCMVWAGFPRGPWEKDRARALEIQRVEADAGVGARAGAGERAVAQVEERGARGEEVSSSADKP